jgi:hypothetical protein
MILASTSTLVEVRAHEGKHGTAGAGFETVNSTTHSCFFFQKLPICGGDRQNKTEWIIGNKYVA